MTRRVPGGMGPDGVLRSQRDAAKDNKKEDEVCVDGVVDELVASFSEPEPEKERVHTVLANDHMAETSSGLINT